MTQRFEDWYFKQNHLGIEPIDHARESYKAGEASRQEEIDLLEKEIVETQEFLNNQNCVKQAEINELQKRINLCVSYIEDNHLNEKDLVLLVYGCLKGEINV